MLPTYLRICGVSVTDSAQDKKKEAAKSKLSWYITNGEVYRSPPRLCSTQWRSVV